LDQDDPVLVWNIARCYEEMGQAKQAIRFYKDYMGMVSDPARRKAARVKIKKLRNADLGVLEIHVRPKDAQVFVNGENFDVSNGPTLVLPGTYRIEVVHPGYEPAARTVHVAKGHTVSTRFKLTMIGGNILVQALPRASYAEVSLDGHVVYEGPLPGTIQCAFGKHHITVRRAMGFQDYDGAVDVAGGSTATVKLVRVPFQETDLLTGDNMAVTPRKPITKPALTWTGLGLILIGGGFHIWGYVQSRRGETHYKWKYYTAYGLYGAGAVLLITGLALPERRSDEFAWSITPWNGGAAIGFIQKF